MNIANKIRGAMHLKGVSIKELAEALGVKPSSISNKFSRNSFSAKDLILIADVLGFELCLLDDTNKIILDKGNIEQE